jgi:hypothetical protein
VALYLNGDALARLGERKSAITVYSKAEKKAKNDFIKAMILNARGVAYAYLKNIDKAIQDLEKATRLAPNFADVHASLGAVLLMKEAPEGSLLNFENALAQSKNFALALNGRGCARYGQRDPENIAKAIQDFYTAAQNSSIQQLAMSNAKEAMDDIQPKNTTSISKEGMSLMTNNELSTRRLALEQHIQHNEKTLQVLPWLPDVKIGKVGWETGRIRENTLRNLDMQKQELAAIKSESHNRGIELASGGVGTEDMQSEYADKGNWPVKTWFGLAQDVDINDLSQKGK